MAYAVLWSKLSSSQITQIKVLLYFQAPTLNKYQRGSTPPIRFFRDEGDRVHLPFLFASSLLQIIPNEDIIYPERTFTFTGSLRDYQVPVRDEAWAQLQTFGTTILGLHPGFGKTALASELISHLHGLTVILLTRDILIQQWKKTFTTMTNARVGVVGVDQELANYDILICMAQRVDKIPLAVQHMVKILVIDEAHMLCTPHHVQALLTFHPQYILALTATLERDDEQHRMIHAMCGEHGVFRETTKAFTVVKILTGIIPERQTGKNGALDWEHLVLTTLMSERRNQLILNLVNEHSDRKILILTSRKYHTEYLHELFVQAQIPCDYLCGKKGSYDDSGVVIGTVSKIGTGFDPATSCANYQGKPFDLLILACSMKKYTMLTQNIGRVFRSEEPIVLHLVDEDGIYHDHWRKAHKWYHVRGAEVVVRDLTKK